MDDFSAISWAAIAFIYGYMFGAWRTDTYFRNKEIKAELRRSSSAKDDRHLEEWCKRQARKEEQAAKALVDETTHGYTP